MSIITAIRPLVVNVTTRTNWVFVIVESDDDLRGVGEGTLDGHEVQVLAVVGDDRDRPRVGDHLTLGLVAVFVAEAVDAHRRDAALPGRLRVDPLHFRRSRPRC